MKLGEILAPQARFLNPTGGCYNCPRKRRDFVPPTMSSAPVIVVGEAPGEEEVEKGEGFVGRSGKVIRSSFRANGITHFDLTNTIHCRPPGNETPGDKEVSCCLNQFTLNEVRGYPLVVLAGAVPIRAFFPGVGADKLRGNIAYHPDFPGQRFYSMYHPAAVLHNERLKPAYDRQVERLGRIVQGEAPKFSLVSGNPDEFMRKLDACLDTGIVCVDVETAAQKRANALRSWESDGRVRSIAFAGNSSEALFVHRDEPHFLAAVERFGKFAAQRESQIVGFNLGFDLVWLEADTGIEVRSEFIHDVQVLWYHVRGYQQIGLKELDSREGDGYRYLVINPETEKDLWLLGMYNAEDVVKPMDLFYKGVDLLTPKQLDLFLRVAGPSALTLRRCTHNGYHFRRDRWEANRVDLDSRRAKVIVDWQAADPKFRPDLHLSPKEGASGNNFASYLFEVHSLPILTRSKSGDKPTMDDAVLKELIRQGAGFLQNAVNLRQIDKRKSTYVDNYLAYVASDGRIHPQLHSVTTDSMRTSSSDPNVQNVDRDAAIRGQYGVAPGRRLVQSDFSQIQLRIAMSLAKDPVGIDAYRSGKDLHFRTAQMFAGENPSKEDRSKAKPINFALIFDGTAWTLQQYAQNEYGVIFSMDQSEAYVRGFFDTYRMLRPWHESERQSLIANKGWGEQITGFRFYYRDWDNPDEKVAGHAHRAHINSKCQGPEAAICLYTMVLTEREIMRRRLPVKLMGEVHDSIHADAPDSDDVCLEYLDCVNTAVRRVEDWISAWFLVPLVMDHEWGETWSSKDLVKVG